MDQHRLWLMTEAQYHSFIGNKTKLYYETYQKDVDDTLLIQYYTHIIIYFLRKRKFSSENPHTAEKLIYTAVALFRRYYLVNPLYSQEPTQAIICAIYISLKLNEYREDEIEKCAQSWKKKKQLQGPGKNVHYGEEEYSQRQLHFLQGIGFHIGRSPLIQPLEALSQQIKVSIGNQHYTVFQRHLLEKLKHIYFDPSLIFLYQGPKIALCLVIVCLKRMKVEKWQQKFREEIQSTIQQHKKEIEGICERIEKTEDFNYKNSKKELNELRNLTKSKKKQFQKPQFSKKSPRFSGRSFSFPEIPE